MFCSNCGKTLKPGDTHCPHCGAAVGKGPFSTTSYTTALPEGELGADDMAFESAMHEEESYAPYTRTSYTSMEEGDGDIFSRTTYRPVLDAQQDPETQDQEVSEEKDGEGLGSPGEADAIEAEKGSEGTEDDADIAGEGTRDVLPEGSDNQIFDVDASIPDESIEVPSLQPISRPGISAEVKSYMEQAQDQRKQTVAAHSKKEFSIAGIFGKKQADDFAESEAKDGDEFESLDGFAEGVQSDDVDASQLNLLGDDQPKSKGKVVLGRFKPKKVLGAAFAAVVIVALLVVGVRQMVKMFTPVAKIPDVSVELYSKGTELIKTHVTTEYREELVKLYIDDPSTVSFMAKQEKDMQALDALLPQDEGKQKKGDKKFVTALKKIQEVINRATWDDAMVKAATNEDTKANLAAAADKEWAAIQNLITRLESAISTKELTGLTETADQVLTTPEPEPDPTQSPYSVLKNGMRGTEEIEALQQRLKDLGYFTSKVDGDFGTKTVRAVKSFQRAISMDDDGIASPEMQAELFADDAPAATPKPDATAAAEDAEGAEGA